jgi:hypothetical protein
MVLHIVLLGCGLSFFTTVLVLLLKKKISEWNSIAWFTCALLILLMAANPELIDWAAAKAGVDYPPSLLFLFSVLILLLLVLYQSMQISDLQKKLQVLAQHAALHHPVQGAPARLPFDNRLAVGDAEAAAAGEADENEPANAGTDIRAEGGSGA